ncbi:TRAP transporter small permease [uncultured Cohaesibacter sp.]|uniref:TRAP transporter small permease n=1 Tax=uncultured Cohaesibacter sp. TaxID=1002546 RepID=UPI0029C91442|nr:TRAP transporter small permease [uncultured Cohaesibacter sp.]
MSEEGLSLNRGSDRSEQRGGRARRMLEGALQAIAFLSGIVLVGLMLLVAISVFFRYALNQPILGSQELVQLGMVVMVMLAMPNTAYRSLHIRVDILDRVLGSIGCFLTDMLARLLGMAVLSILVVKSWAKMLDALEYEDVTNMLELPVWVAYASISAGMALYAGVLLLQLISQFGNWREYRE